VIEIRRATDADRVPIARVHEASIRALGPRAYTAEEVASWAAHIYPRNYQIQQQIFVATDEDRVVGFGHYHAGEIMALYVDPQHVGRGAGRALMAALEEVARVEGTTHLFLNAALNSVGFYETCGYRRTKDVRYRTRGGVVMSCAFMEKDL
jgi:putative acetyltransferase